MNARPITTMHRFISPLVAVLSVSITLSPPTSHAQHRYCQVDDVSTNIGYVGAMMTTSKSIDRGYRFPADVIEQAVWLSIRFPQPQDGRGSAGGARDHRQL